MILATQFPLTDPMHKYAVCMSPYQSALAAYDKAEPLKDQFISVDEPTRTLRTFNTENDTLPVSYTHLDVYKRQHLASSLSFLGSFLYLR